ncbi:MAG TPA: MFS transporter [Gordonia sp. (in: high G+C Gram-positive bacteria)]|uniref:MFS transporter n=1 Tax=unclassified Gordonia (in: high G+C Gram-positive bacteria) TaxID=2657482 RepID=UPI0025C3EE8B|nr:MULTISPECIES: MFS transporter [unclassified Gordonia (in: high G+C Gram-positive bacteria)]HNP57471.1 MFS transporter [Gordonia sp. (in: high G+C Gram-positive bacteria)]HRC52694.1 MFS transporter [Gordonia sp. (in: high G+C Gram-positive bacteria)]
MDASPGQGAPGRIPPTIWVLVCAAFVIAVGYGLVAPVLPAFARSFDVSIAAATMVVSAFAVMRLAFAPATAPLLRRLGERPVYLAGLLIVAASMLACAFAQSYWQLLVLRALGGVGSVMFTVSAMSLVIRISPPAIRGRVSGVYSSSFVLGGIVGPLIGGALAGLGYRAPFVVYAAALVVATIVVAVALRHTEAVGDAADERSGPGVREALADGAYRAVLVTSVVYGWLFAMRITLVPLFFTDVLDQSVSMAGFALAAYAAGDVAVMIPAGRASDRLGRRPFLISGMVVLAASTAVLGMSDSVVVAFIATAIAGAGTGLVAPVIQATVADVLYGGRGGTALSTYQMAQDSGTIAGPVIAGVIADRFGFGPAFWLTAALSAVVALIWVVTRETRGRTPLPTPPAQPDL